MASPFTAPPAGTEVPPSSDARYFYRRQRWPRRPGLTHYAGHNPQGHPRVAIARTGEQWCADVHTNEEVDGTLLSPAEVNQHSLTPQACLALAHPAATSTRADHWGGVRGVRTPPAQPPDPPGLLRPPSARRCSSAVGVSAAPRERKNPMILALQCPEYPKIALRGRFCSPSA
jgi:hypothetical protein